MGGGGWASVLGLVAGCAQGASPGALEQVDVAVVGQNAPLGVDAPFAVGANVTLDFALVTPGVAAESLRLEAARPEVMTLEGATVTARSEGMTALLVRADERVVDFLHLTAVAADRLGLDRPERGPVAGRIQLLVGDEVRLSPVLYRGEERLLGERPVTMEADGEVVTVLDEGLGAQRRVVARTPGRTTLTATMAERTTTLELEVLP